MTVKEKLDALRQIYADAQQKAAPLVAELKPYIEAARQAERLGITAGSTADEIIDAFAGSVDFKDAPEVALVPQVLDAGAPAAIAKLGEDIQGVYKTIGAAVGQLAALAVNAMK